MLVRTAAAGMGWIPGDPPSIWSCSLPGAPSWSAECQAYIFPQQNVSPSPVPSPGALAAPWQGPDAMATAQQAMVDEQMRAQQALNAGIIQTTPGSVVGGALYQTGAAVAPALPWVGIALVGIGILALIILLKVK